MYEKYGLFIGGTWRGASDGGTYSVLNPATEESLGDAPAATVDDVEAAIAAAEDGLKTWRKTQPWERARIIRRIGELMQERIEDLARTMTLEIGKPLAQSRIELQMSIEQFTWYAEETKRIYGQLVEARTPDHRIMITYQPVGVVAAFSAWNFPAVLSCRKIAPALAAGCAIIVRPSEEGPGTVMGIVKCCEDAGVPPGVVNLLVGKASKISAPIMASTAVRKISLTGSTDVGKLIIRQSADTVKKLSMELGGHAPVLVFDDVDPVKAADTLATAKYRNAGQVCVSPTRFYVHEKSKKAFTERFVEVAKKLKLGNGLDPETEMGPLATRKRLEDIERMVEQTRGEGATLLAGGKRPAGFNRGFFYEPTVFDDVRDDGVLMTEEPFGPVAPLTTFRDFDEVIERANSLEMGLAGFVFTSSQKTANAASERLETGMVGVNTMAIAMAEAPFGGIKQSGFGREGGSLGIKDYLDVKLTSMVMV
ncbi:MAG: NAD-dependent succinate-semialdehyde dehydrogenase [Alphaproteobacteria bacterium]